MASLFKYDERGRPLYDEPPAGAPVMWLCDKKWAEHPVIQNIKKEAAMKRALTQRYKIKIV